MLQGYVGQGWFMLEVRWSWGCRLAEISLCYSKQPQFKALLCRCQSAKSIRSWERAWRGWERKLQQETTKMGSRGSDTSPQRDAVWHQLYSASHIYTEQREKDKTVNIFFVDLYLLQTVTRNLQSMGMAPCYYFLHQITFLCAWEVCTELQVPAVNNRLISGVAGQRAMFASKPSRTEAAPRAVSFGQRTPFWRAAPRTNAF